MKHLSLAGPARTICVTKEFSFEMAHALTGYDGVCSEIHGHSYKLFVTVSGTPSADASSPKAGMVVDFGELKRIVKEHVVDLFDHAMLLRAAESDVAKSLGERFTRIITTDFQPTCENLTAYIADVIEGNLPAGVALRSVRLHETATSYAEVIR